MAVVEVGLVATGSSCSYKLGSSSDKASSKAFEYQLCTCVSSWYSKALELALSLLKPSL
jgi:hypothetical protein